VQVILLQYLSCFLQAITATMMTCVRDGIDWIISSLIRSSLSIHIITLIELPMNRDLLWLSIRLKLLFDRSVACVPSTGKHRHVLVKRAKKILRKDLIWISLPSRQIYLGSIRASQSFKSSFASARVRCSHTKKEE